MTLHGDIIGNLLPSDLDVFDDEGYLEILYGNASVRGFPERILQAFQNSVKRVMKPLYEVTLLDKTVLTEDQHRLYVHLILVSRL